MVAINSSISIITLSINDLNISIKRQIVREDQKIICCLQETHFKYKNTYRLKVKGWRKIYHVNTNLRKT